MNIDLKNYQTYLLNIKKSLVYYNYLRVLFKYLEEKNIMFLDLTKEQLAQFFTDKEYQPNSINNVLKAGKDFCKFQKQENNPFIEIPLVIPETRIRTYISYDELQKAIRYYATYYTRGTSSQKTSIILKFLFYTGIRKGELLSLKRENIDITNNCAVIWGQKTKQERIVYFPSKITKELIIYFNSEKEQLNAFNITNAELISIIKKIGHYLNKKISPHSLRHSGAKYMIEKMGNPMVVQKILGHKSLQSTLIYANPDDKIASDTYRKKIG